MGNAGYRAIAILAAIFVASARCALALNPSLDVNQYAHTAWTIRDGFFKSVILSIAQTADGYLWLGTESGLLRFDGVRAVPWTPSGGEDLSVARIMSLLGTPDGALWIGTDKALVSWKGTKLTRYPELNGRTVTAIVADRDGTVWAGARAVPKGMLCEIQGAKTRCFGQDGSLGGGVFSIYNDGRGALWVGAASGLWRWKPGAPQAVVSDPKKPVNGTALSEAAEGKLFVGTAHGMLQLVNGKPEPYQVPGASAFLDVTRFLRDRDGGLWIGTRDKGLLHLRTGDADAFARSDGLSGDLVRAIFEDREGTIWVSTSGGLDRFREFAVSTVSAERLLSGYVWSVLAGRDGSLWVGGPQGLSRWKDRHVTHYGKADGLPDDSVQSLFQDDAGRIWMSTPHGLVSFENGRFSPPAAIPGAQGYAFAAAGAGNLWITGRESLLRFADHRLVEQIPWSELGASESAIAIMSGAEPGGIWLGFRLGRGVVYFRDGKIRQSYTPAEGLGAGAVYGLKLDRDGAVWAATAGGLSLIRNGRVTTLTSNNGLPCNTIHLVIDDHDRSTWLYTGCGFVRLEKAELEAWKTDPKRTVRPTLFDNSDGVLIRSSLTGVYGPRITVSPDDRLWFLPGNGPVDVVDPHHLPINKLPPPVHIEQIIADRRHASKLRLPALTRDLEIDYTALSLVAPEKNRFKYKLEGHDEDWQDAGDRRQAFYNDLPPRRHRFRVIACNNSGVWNEAGDTLEFSIAPAYYQTTWFYTSCAAALVALLYGLHQLRLRQMAREFNAQLDGRVDERLRVARELHDTLLQTFQMALIQMQAAYNTFSRQPETALETLEAAISISAGAIAEGRDAIQNMRASTVLTNDLARALRVAGDELAAQGTARFEVRVQGSSRDLHAILRDEVYRIALEALRNAFRHSEAQAIEAEILYGDSLRVRIRDDGKGIPPGVMHEGRSGHYGLPGMRERAERIGGKLDVRTGPGAGTEIQLSIPGVIAFGAWGANPLRRKPKSDAAAEKLT